MEKRIIAHLVGLAGAISNNGKSDHTDALIKKALFLVNQNPSEDEVNRVIEQIEEEKHMISPSCLTCPSPCGNTSSYNLEKFNDDSDNVKILKEKMIESCIKLLMQNPDKEVPKKVYEAIYCFGYNLKDNTYQKIIDELENI